MQPIHRIALAFLAVGLLVSWATAALLESAQPGPPGSAPVPAANPLRLVHAQPFQLDEPYVHAWRAERPLVAAGYLLVLATDPQDLARRQAAEPVLFVGEQTAERLNDGATYGRIVVVVPAGVDQDGEVDLDLARTPIWFGEPALPERVDADDIERSRAAALARGVRPPLSAELETARASGGDTVYLPTRMALRLYATDLLEAHAPDEVDLIRGIRGY